VGTSFSVSDIDVGFLASHTWRTDIRVTLQSPSGTRVQLLNGSQALDVDNYNIRLSDEAATEVDTAPHNVADNTGVAPYQNTVRPQNLLSAFDGENALGTWRLEICDTFPSADNGTFLRADLFITQAAAVTGADLSLTKTASNSNPASGSTISYTLTVRNAANSSLNATGVEVRDTLPVGFTFTSATGAGTYNSGTGVWTVGNLAIGASATITITGIVTGTSGTPIVNVAEISASNQNDPDSTVNNGAAGEDDYASATVVIAGTRPAGVPPAFICPAGQTVLDWDTVSWTSGSTNNNYTVATLGNVNAAITNQGAWVSNATYGGLSPTRQNIVTGGLSPAEFSIFQFIDFATTAQVATTTVTLPVAVTAARFTIFDVDFNSGQFADRIRVTATYNGTNVPVTLTNGVANYVIGDQAFGDGLSADASANGNVVVTIALPVDTIIIEYGNHNLSPSNPGGQAIALHDIIMCQPNGDLVIDKSNQIISVPANAGTDPYHIPGAVIRYCLLVTNIGSATATAVSLSDTLPTDVTYNPGSLRFGPTCANATSVEDDDAAGADETPEGASFAAGVVSGTIGSLTGGATRALTFEVTLN
jgi:uncharacterized repeat protein (TIGR01451 family)